MTRLAAPLLTCALALLSAQANAETAASPPAAAHHEAARPAAPNGPQSSAAERQTADDVCRTLEQAAAENTLPVAFFARVIWQESRFNARAVSRKGAEGIAQFMPATADWRGLADPFDSIAALKNSASYLRDLRDRFGNLGLAAAGYNAGPDRVSGWLAGNRALPTETRDYVAIVTGWTADEWASQSPPQTADTTIPQGVPCARLADLVLAPKDLAPKEETKRVASHIPRWGVRLAAHVSESKAWGLYREVQKRFAALLADRDPIVLHKQIPGMGRAKRYIITIADDNRAPLDTLCRKLIAAGGTCDVMNNGLGHG